jgi:multidrug resistance efflux pump
VLWTVWLAICAVLWVLLLDTSYDWISSTSNAKVVFGFVILVSMVGVVIALVVKGVRLLWTR